jgi:hypothetical protein
LICAVIQPVDGRRERILPMILVVAPLFTKDEASSPAF